MSKTSVVGEVQSPVSSHGDGTGRKTVLDVVMAEVNHRVEWPEEDPSGQEAWVCGKQVWEFDVREATSYKLEEIARMLDADGGVVGFVCPACGQPVLLDDAEWLEDKYRGCSHCDEAVVWCPGLPSDED